MQVFEITNDSGNPAVIEPIGDAKPIWRDDRLIVSNIGSSGKDGIAIGLVPHTDGNSTSLLARVVTPWWDEGDRHPVGAVMSTSIYGIVDSGQEQLIGNCSLVKTGTSTYDYMLDFSPLGASQNMFEVGQPGGASDSFLAPAGTLMTMHVDVDTANQVPVELVWGTGPLEDPGGIPVPFGQLAFCGSLFECEYHSMVGVDSVRMGNDVMSFDPTRELETTGTPFDPLADVESYTRLEYRFANIETFTFDSIESLISREVLAGDFDDDGFVGAEDLNMTLFHWGKDESKLPPEWVIQRPLPGDSVGSAALNAVLFGWGNSLSPSPSAVPEPSACSLLLVAAAGLTSRRGKPADRS